MIRNGNRVQIEIQGGMYSLTTYLSHTKVAELHTGQESAFVKELGEKVKLLTGLDKAEKLCPVPKGEHL